MLVFQESQSNDWLEKAIAQSIANGSMEIVWNPDKAAINPKLRKELDKYMKNAKKKP